MQYILQAMVERWGTQPSAAHILATAKYKSWILSIELWTPAKFLAYVTKGVAEGLADVLPRAQWV